MSPSLPQDAQARQTALDTSLSCCVQAPAGSGKTELLTQRILKLLADCERPEEILAITFTRKAAAEMRNRLLENLEEAAGISTQALSQLKPHKQQTLALARAVLVQDERKGWGLLANTSRLRINTIDSFNQFLVNQLPVTSALGLLPDITEKPDAIFREAVHDTLRELDSDTPLASELGVLLTHLNNNWTALEHLFCRLLANRDQWLSYILRLKGSAHQSRELMEQTLGSIITQNLQELENALSPYLPQLLPVLQFAVANLACADYPVSEDDIADSMPDTTPTALGKWQAVLGILLKKDFTPRQKVMVAQGFPAQSVPGSKEEKEERKTAKQAIEQLLQILSADTALLAKFNEISFLPAGTFHDAQWRVLESLTIILPELVSRLSLVFARNSKTDYNHVSAAALEALGDEDNPTDLALRLDYHLRHILVDEFQDTSSLQIRLLRKLTSGWQPGDGRTLFIVGDGMQSCYGFRNARVGLFLAARDNGIGDLRFEDLRLSCNFRSEAAVVNWVNDIFQEAFPAQDDISRGGVSFNPATAIHDSSVSAGVNTVLVCAEKEKEIPTAVLRHHEALQVADTIVQIQHDFPEDSIAVLVRGKSHLRELIAVLRQRKLQWQASDIDPLLSYPVVSDLLNLTRALLNVADTPAWLALARSPLVGLRLADIELLARTTEIQSCSFLDVILGYGELHTLSTEAHNILERVQPVLQQARSQRQRLPLRDWVENAWLLLGGPATLSDPQLADNTEQFFALLEEHDDSGDVRDIHLFERELQSLSGSDQQPDARLQIMTIHKAKGLEFHHVLIPGLDRRPRGNLNPLLLWKEHITDAGEERLVMSLPSRKGQSEDDDPVYRYLKCELELEQQLESTRLLYIGVTRAIRQCVLFACNSVDAGSYASPANNSLLARIWPQLLPRLELPECRIISLDENSTQPPGSSVAQNTQHILSRRLPPQWLNPVSLLTTEQSRLSASQLADERTTLNLLERKTGDIIHHCLMLMSRGQLDSFTDEALALLIPGWRRQLASLTTNVDAALTEIQRQLHTCSEHQHFDWLVRTPHQNSASELALSHYMSSGRRAFIIDRTFIDADGQRWIVDYKSSRLPEGQSLETFIVGQEILYREQLERYGRLFTDMAADPVRLALFFTAIPYFHELSSQSSQSSRTSLKSG